MSIFSVKWRVGSWGWLVALAVGACGPGGGADGGGESSSGGDTTAAPGDDDDDDDDDDDVDTTAGSGDETGESTTTGDESTGTETGDTTGEPVEVPELEFVVRLRRADDVERHLERFVMIDGEFGEPIQASEPIPGSAEVVQSYPVPGKRQMVYHSQAGADDNVYLADYGDPETTVYQQLDVDPGAITEIFVPDVDVVAAPPTVIYNDTTQHFAVKLEDGGAGAPILIYEEPTPVSSAVYLREPTSALAFVGINDGDTSELWLSDLAGDPSELIPVGSPTTPWQDFSGAGILPDDAGVLYRSDVTAAGAWDVFVAPLQDGELGAAQALSSVTAPAFVSWAETHPYSNGVVYTWQADDDLFGQSEFYWVPLDGTEPGDAVAINNDGLGRISTKKYSDTGRYLVYEGTPLDDGAPLSYYFVDFEGGAPSAPVPLGLSGSAQVTFHGTDRWLYYYDGPPFDLYRADLTADPVEHQLVAEGVAIWGRMSPDGTTLCIDDDLDDVERFLLVDVSGDTVGDTTVIEVDVPGDRLARFCSISADGNYLFYNEAEMFSDRALVVLDLDQPETPLLRIDSEGIDGPWHLPAPE